MAKLGVVIHNLAHQLLDHLLSDEAIHRQFCDCLRDSVDDFICFSPAGETVARSTWRTRCRAISVSAADTFTSVHRFKGSIPQGSSRCSPWTVQPSHP